MYHAIQAPQKRCGHCWACKSVDCGQCRYCLDKKFGGHNRLKQCCIHRQCNSYNTSSSVDKQPPPTHSEFQDTLNTLIELAGPFHSMFAYNISTFNMQPFNARLPPLEHSVALQGFQTPKEEVLKVRDAWSIYIAMYISYSHVATNNLHHYRNCKPAQMETVYSEVCPFACIPFPRHAS